MTRVLTAVRRLPEFAPTLLAVYAALLFVATHLPPTQLPTALPGSDKHWHFAAYFGLGCLTYLSTSRGNARWPVRAWLCIWAFAALDELLQIPVGRTAELLDWVADVAGAAAGITAASFLATGLMTSRMARSSAS